jgi:hypothetical protein
VFPRLGERKRSNPGLGKQAGLLRRYRSLA